MLSSNYEVRAETPDAAEYRRLRVAAGMSAKSAEAAAIGLPNTLFAATVRQGERLVGMGRVVGDGGLFFEVVDIAVEPEHQGRGIGKAVGTLVDYVRRTAHAGAFVSLIADGEAHRLYAQFGFVPTTPASIGTAFTIL